MYLKTLHWRGNADYALGLYHKVFGLNHPFSGIGIPHWFWVYLSNIDLTIKMTVSYKHCALHTGYLLKEMAISWVDGRRYSCIFKQRSHFPDFSLELIHRHSVTSSTWGIAEIDIREVWIWKKKISKQKNLVHRPKMGSKTKDCWTYLILSVAYDNRVIIAKVSLCKYLFCGWYLKLE